MSDPILFSMPGNEVFAARLGKILQWEKGELQMRRFPDGETILRFVSSVAQRDIAIVCTLDHPDDALWRPRR